MNNDRELFRQALRRQNERAARMEMPDDMEQRVMERIRPKKANRHRLYPIIAAVAASVLLVLMLHFNNSNVESIEKAVAAKNAQQQNAIATLAEDATESATPQEATAIAQPIQPGIAGGDTRAPSSKRVRKARKKTKTEIPAPQKKLAEVSETMSADPSVQTEREFRAEAASIRQRGEQLMQHVASHK